MNPFSTTTKLEERLVLSATHQQIPVGGAFELLPLCNMNCQMCFLRLTPEEMRIQGRMRTVAEWLALAHEGKEAGLLFLLLTGGEPFLYPDFDKLYQGLCKLGFFITINSNGTLITEDLAELLAKHKPRRVNITLYGSSNEIYGKLCGNSQGFTQAMNGIKLLKERGISVKLNGSLVPGNKDDLEKIQLIAKELEIPLEVDTYMFEPIHKKVCGQAEFSRLTAREAAEGFVKVKQEVLSEEEFMKLAKAMSECYHRKGNFEGEVPLEILPCRAGRSSFWINWKGDMTPCVFMDKPAIPVFENGFAKSWEYIKQERDKLFMPPVCSKCEKRLFCTVCGACAYTETGDFQIRPEYMCEFTQEKLRLMSEIAEEQKK